MLRDKLFFPPNNKILYLLLITLVLIIFVITLLLMGRVPICECGIVKLWHGKVLSSENSQHISDWYSFSHIIHGFVFYWFLRKLGKKYEWPILFTLLLAVLIETSWEVFENTNFVINRYREINISLNYYGDSVINSFFDVVFMITGFLMAWRLPVWSVISAAVFMEIFVGFSIRDNFTLNVIMLIHPFDFILNWQAGYN